MKVIDIIKGEKPSLSFEVFPPKLSANFDSVMQATAKIAELKPSFMSVTYGAGGGTSKYTADIASSLMSMGVTPLAHLSCISSKRDEIELLLSDLKKRGIENILALRGDIPDGMDKSNLEYHYASELAAEIRDFGGFCIGGACYPENHPESKNSKADIDSLKIKVENDNLELSGNNERAIIYAVYTFLEKYVGCRWYTKDVERIIFADTVTVPNGTVWNEKPILEYRYPMYHTCKESYALCLKQKINAGVPSTIEGTGESLSYNGFVHTLGSLLPKEK